LNLGQAFLSAIYSDPVLESEYDNVRLGQAFLSNIYSDPAVVGSAPVFSSVSVRSGGTVTGQGTSTLTFTRAASNIATDEMSVEFTIPAGTLTVARQGGGNFSGYWLSPTSPGAPTGYLGKEGLYWFVFPENANSASRNLTGISARWDLTNINGSKSYFPVGASITLTIA
jgi:hypothetical protein